MPREYFISGPDQVWHRISPTMYASILVSMTCDPPVHEGDTVMILEADRRQDPAEVPAPLPVDPGGG